MAAGGEGHRHNAFGPRMDALGIRVFVVCGRAAEVRHPAAGGPLGRASGLGYSCSIARPFTLRALACAGRGAARSISAIRVGAEREAHQGERR